MIRLLLALTSLSVLCAAPVVAQQNNDPRGFRLSSRAVDHRDVTVITPPEVTMMRTASCLADDHPEQVNQYLRTVPASPAEGEFFSAFQRELNRCMPQMDMSMVGNLERGRGTLTMRFEHSALRGALAESMMREFEIQLVPAQLALGEDGMYVAEQFHGSRSPDVGRTFALGFAGCVMGFNSDQIDTLLATEPASADERDAIIGMAPSFGQCVMEGQELRLQPSTLRNQIAEVVYYAHFASATLETSE